MRAKLGMRKVRPWKWMAFTNPARKDGLVLHHWRRSQDEGKDYPFARFNKVVEVPSYTDMEYSQHLNTPEWGREETDHLMDLANRFDLRFIIMADRWDRETYSARSVEDLKERYYSIVEKLERVHGGATGAAAEQGKKQWLYDADHERRRKEQLRRLYNRTEEQLEEEEMLKAELRKIEARKKEREKKTADLQKMIAQADASSGDGKKLGKKQKLIPGGRLVRPEPQPETTGIRWPDGKASGVTLRSARMKLPNGVGLKKTKAIESMCLELGLEAQPPCTDDICTEFNELRSEMVLLYELKNALTNSELELSSLKHQYEAIVPGKSLSLPQELLVSNTALGNSLLDTYSVDSVLIFLFITTNPGRQPLSPPHPSRQCCRHCRPSLRSLTLLSPLSSITVVSDSPPAS